VTSCKYLRIAANDETVGYAAKYSGIVEGGEILIEVRAHVYI